MSSYRIVVVSAGLGRPSTTRMLADQLAEATGRHLQGDGAAVEVETVELREIAHEITDAALAGFAGGRLREVLTAVEEADAVIAVSPIFKASYTGLFKSFMDVLDADALIGKPVLVAATGGTPRHSLALDHALRPLFAYMQALVVPTGVYASPADWGATDDWTGALAGRVDRAATELAGLLRGAGTGRGREEEFDMFSPAMLAAARP